MNNSLDTIEIIYQITMNYAKKMLVRELISKEEYMDFESKMREKYKPIIGSIYSDIDLI